MDKFLLLTLVLWCGTISLWAKDVALIVCISDYKEFKTLTTPVQDGEAVGNVLRQHYGYEIRLLKDGEATKQRLIQEFRRLVAESKQEQLGSLVVYYAGHGLEDKDLEEGYWILADAKKNDFGSFLSNQELKKYVQIIKTRQLLLVSDSCFSGTLIARSVTVEPGMDDDGRPKPRQPKAIGTEPVKLVLTSGGKEPVLDSSEAGRDRGHSVFAIKFLDVLKNNRSEMELMGEDSRLYQELRDYLRLNASQKPQVGFLKDAGSDYRPFVFRYTTQQQQYVADNFLGEWQSNYGKLVLTGQGGKRNGAYDGGRITDWKVEGTVLLYSFVEEDGEAGSGRLEIVSNTSLKGGHRGHETWQAWPASQVPPLPQPMLSLPVVSGYRLLLGQSDTALAIEGRTPWANLKGLTGESETGRVKTRGKQVDNQATFALTVPLPAGKKARVRVTAYYEHGRSHRLIYVNRLATWKIVPETIALDQGTRQSFTCHGVDLDGKLYDNLPVSWSGSSCINAQGVFVSDVAGDYSIVAKPQRLAMMAVAKITVKSSKAVGPGMNQTEVARKLSQRLFRGAEEHYDARRWAEAVSAYNEAEAIGFRSQPFYLHRATSQEHLGNYKAAVNDCRLALELASGQEQPAIYCQLGNLYEWLKEWQTARNAYHEARTLNPARRQAWLREGAIELSLNNLDAAATALNQAIRLQEDGPAYYLRGRVAQKRQQWAEAKRDFDRSLGLDSSLATSVNPNLATVTSELDKIKQARLDTEKQQFVSNLAGYYGARGELTQNARDLAYLVKRMQSQEQELKVLRYVNQGVSRWQAIELPATRLEQEIMEQDSRYQETSERPGSEAGNSFLRDLIEKSRKDAQALPMFQKQAKSLQQEMIAAKDKARIAKEEEKRRAIEAVRQAELKRQQEELRLQQDEIARRQRVQEERAMAVRLAEIKRKQEQTSQSQWVETSSDGRYKRASNDVIWDTMTNLEWYVGPDQDTAWDAVKAWADSLTIAGGGWRMPSRTELKGIYGGGQYGADPLFKLSNWRWIWTGVLTASSEAWYVYFYDGGESSRHRNFSRNGRAFCVRTRSK